MLNPYPVQKNGTLVPCCSGGRLHFGVWWSRAREISSRNVRLFGLAMVQARGDQQATVIASGDKSSIRRCENTGLRRSCATRLDLAATGRALRLASELSLFDEDFLIFACQPSTAGDSQANDRTPLVSSVL